MELMFLGAAHEVTGSCTLLSVGDKKILIDCGMEQGPDLFENCELPVAPSEIDAIFLTHAHIDHSGKIPFCVANGFRGNIYTTRATERLINIMLKDSAHIQEEEAKWRNRKSRRSGEGEYTPLYTLNDVHNTLELVKSCDYNQPITVFDGITVEFYDAGHLLGSSSILFTLTENGLTKKVLFSGDLGNPPRPLLCSPAIPPKCDYVIVESTYGDRVHGERPDYITQLTEIIQDTLDRGGNLVIPSFAVGRTQELLYLIRIIKERKIVKYHDNFPVYLDSPLAVEATEVYSSKLTEYFNEETLKLLEEGVNPISFKNLKLSLTETSSRAINEDACPKIIISASGMCEAGRIRHHLKHNLWREDSTVLFVGYQTEGTVGRRLLDGARSVKLFSEDIAVNARICRMDGISSHSDKNMLIDWIKNTNAEKVFVNHGSDSVCDRFCETVKQQLGKTSVAPYSGDRFDLATGSYIVKAPIVKIISKKAFKQKRNLAVYEKLSLAGRRLMAIIEQSKGLANKELGKLTNQINELCNKYERK